MLNNRVIFYGYKIKRKEFWPFVHSVRQYYKQYHLMFNLRLNDIYKVVDEDSANKAYEVIMQLLNTPQLKNNGGAEIEIFEWSTQEYIFRVLERSYFFRDSHAKEKWPLTEIIYDETLGVLPELLLNRKYVEFVDDKIIKQEYFITPIFTRDDLNWHYDWKYLQSKPWENHE